MDAKLSQLTADGGYRAKVGALLSDLEARGLDPKIYETKRTIAQQREKVRKGYSRTMNSEHLKEGSDGGSMAADIASKRLAWNAPTRFWFMIGAECDARGLGWGGLFGLNRTQVKGFRQAVIILRSLDWPEVHPAYRVKIGWDAAHVQRKNNWLSFGEKVLGAVRSLFGGAR